MTKPKIDLLRRQIGKALLAAPLVIPLAAYAGSESSGGKEMPRTQGAGKIRRQYVEGRFGQIHLYRIDPTVQLPPGENKKTPLVCFHPTAVSGDYFKYFMLEMGKDRTVIAIDTPGYGKSDAPPEPQTMNNLALGVADALEALGFGENREGGEAGLGPVDVIGYHTGCYIATEIAISRPDLVRRLVLPGIPYVIGKEREESYAKNARLTSFVEDGSGIMKQWEFWVTKRPEGVTLDRGIEHFSDYAQSGKQHWWGYHSVFAFEAEKRLPLVKQPILIPNTHGSLQENTREAAKLFPNATLIEIPELHHGIFDLGVDRLSAVLRPFLDQ